MNESKNDKLGINKLHRPPCKGSLLQPKATPWVIYDEVVVCALKGQLNIFDPIKLPFQGAGLNRANIYPKALPLG